VASVGFTSAHDCRVCLKAVKCMTTLDVAVIGLDWLYAQIDLVGLASLQGAAEACGIDKAALWRYFN
jgi:hypothetical protein